MGRGKKVVLGLLTTAAVAAAGVYAVGWWFGGWGKVDDWIGRQVIGVASAHLVPTVAFKDLTYQPPYSVEIRGVTLTSPEGVEVVHIDQVDLTLGEVPRSGRPVVITSITLHEPTLNLLREPGEGVKFQGLVPFVKHGLDDAGKVPEDFRLSRVLLLDHLQIDDGAVRLDPGGGRPEMHLAGLTLKLDVSEDASGPASAWHTLDIRAGRSPGLVIDLVGRLNMDTLDAELARGRFDMRLSPESRASLPPALQEIVAEYDPRGQLTLQGNGTVPGLRWDKATLSGTLDIVGFSAALGDYALPIDSLTADGGLDRGVFSLERLDAELLHGVLSAGAQGKPADGTKAVTFNWSAYELDLNAMARIKARDGEDPELAGTLNASGQVTLDPGNIPESVAGKGILSIRDGSLVRIPIFSRLAGLLHGSGSGGRDLADADFSVGPAGLHIDKSIILLPFTAARITGTIGYDGRLDLAMNAGPLERLQNALGKVGEVIGKVTDRVVTYRVQGKVGDPTVAVDPLGLAITEDGGGGG
jgi:hypothetical protein